MAPDNRHLLLILDGYGIADDPSVSAIAAADTPYLDDLFATYPHSTLVASGRAVGLPEGQMGNSEVGHMNLGAGRVVHQEITRIDLAIEDGSFFSNDALQQAVAQAQANDSRLHLLGCFSDGGVHSHVRHLDALLDLAAREGLEREQVCVHAFTDGRDTDPHGGVGYVEDVEAMMEAHGVGRIVSIIGRYYAMDRDERWQRTERAYRLLTEGADDAYDSATEALQANYANDVTDEFVEPSVVRTEDDMPTRIANGDAVIFFNFRGDRARQLTRAFTEEGFDGFDRDPLDLTFVIFSPYDETFEVPVAFPKVNLKQTMGEVIAAQGGTQLRAAETEKYPHVTYFFSGGQEEPFEGEDRILIPSPKVATYDLQPEMSAPELADEVAAALAEERHNFVVLNFANPDMVGHTGVFEAAVAAVEAVDAGTRTVVEAARTHGFSVTLIADHGNADKMRNPDGSPNTAHTTVQVPHLIIKEGFDGPIAEGKLGDIAPTMLALMGVPIPEEMTGDVLVESTAVPS